MNRLVKFWNHIKLDLFAIAALRGFLQNKEVLSSILAEYKQAGSTDEDALAHAAYDIAESMLHMSEVTRVLAEPEEPSEQK